MLKSLPAIGPTRGSPAHDLWGKCERGAGLVTLGRWQRNDEAVTTGYYTFVTLPSVKQATQETTQEKLLMGFSL